MIDLWHKVPYVAFLLAVAAVGFSAYALHKMDPNLFGDPVRHMFGFWNRVIAPFGLRSSRSGVVRQDDSVDSAREMSPPVLEPDQGTNPESADEDADSLPSIEVVQGVVERSMDAQADRATSMDQRGAALLGFSGIFVALVIRDLDGLGLPGFVGGLLALAAAWSAAAVIWPSAAPALDPAYLLENYAAAEEKFTRLTVVSTLTDIYASTEARIQVKGRRIKSSSMLIVLAAVVLLLASL